MTQQELEFLVQSNAIEDVYDADSLVQAIYAWEYLKKQKKMHRGVILKTHKILMLNQKHLKGYERGYFRIVPVWVGGREGIDYHKIDASIDHWCMNVEDLWKNGAKEPEVFLERMIKEHHVEYEKIHPFVDGNGRTGRMFLNWQRLKHKLPLLIIHAGEEQQKYYAWFK